MNNILKSLLTISTLTAGSTAFGQGLVSLRPDRDDFERKLPFTVTLDAGVGFDSNTNQSPTDANESLYVNGAVGVQYRGGDRRTSYGVAAQYGGYYFLDPAPTQDSYMQSARLSFDFRHKFNERTTITDSAYVAYEFEPNFQIGAGTTRRTNEYLYYYNDLALSHAWSRSFSTVTGYTITGIDYQDGAINGENFITNIFRQEFRYALTKLTTAAVTYRYAIGAYDNDFGDYTSNYLLAGLDHSFSRRTFGTFRAGAEIRDRDFGGSDTNPYFEGNLSYRADKKTTLNVYARYGFEDSSVGNFQSRESLRTGLTASIALTDRLAATGGLHYIRDSFDDAAGPNTGFDEDVYAISVGLNYALYKNISLTSSYGFSKAVSGNPLREYDRHNLALGVRASF